MVLKGQWHLEGLTPTLHCAFIALCFFWWGFFSSRNDFNISSVCAYACPLCLQKVGSCGGIQVRTEYKKQKLKSEVVSLIRSGCLINSDKVLLCVDINSFKVGLLPLVELCQKKIKPCTQFC